MLLAEPNFGLSCSVLVLNKHYMPLRIINVKRALCMLCRDLAEVISYEQGQYYNYDFDSWRDISAMRLTFEPNEHDWITTVNFNIAVPRIVRLLFYDRLPRNDVKFN